MVREATLRLAVDARGAKAAVDDFNRSAERMNLTVVQSEVKVDKLEAQLEQLNRVTIDNARNTALMRAGIERMAYSQQSAEQQVQRTTMGIERQTKAGNILIKTFGGLAARTVATGGAFLAVDFLARVAGANSLFDLMNKGLDKVADSFRRSFTEAKSFSEVLKEISASSALEGEGLAEFLTRAGSKSRASLPAKLYSTDIPLNIPSLAGENEFLAAAVAKVLADAGADIDKARATINAQGATPDTYRRLQEFKVFRAGQAQEEINRLGAFFENMPDAAKRASKAVGDFNATLAATASVALGGPRSAAGLAGNKVYTGLGFPSMSPQGFAVGTGGLAIQGAASVTTAGIGRDPYGFKQTGGTFAGDAQPGGFWATQIAGASAYAAALTVVDKRQQEARRSGAAFGEAAAASIEDAVFAAGTLEDRLQGLLSSLTRVIFNQLVTQNIASGIGGLFGNANGNVFRGGSVVPFAYGGVISGPTVFPMAGGKTGLMGEKEPEAIMPLGRDSQGRLGVRGGGGTTVNQYFYGPTLDAKSRKQMRDDAQRALR